MRIHADPRRAACLADAIEAAAYADMLACAPAAVRGHSACIDGVTALIAAGLSIPLFNRAIGLGLSRPASLATVTELQALYRGTGVPGWWLHWNPVAQPEGFDGALQAEGFRVPARRTWAKMLRDVAPLDGVRCELAVVPTARRDAAATAAAIGQAFGMPPVVEPWLVTLSARPAWLAFSLRDGSRVVGGAFLHVGGDTGWLGIGGVLPSHRRRGGQLALMAARIAAAAAAGCRQVVTETGEPVDGEPNPSLANMVRAGFARVAARLNLEAPSPP